MKRNLIPTALSCVLAVACQGGGGDSKKSNLPGLEVKTEVTEAGEQSTAADGTKLSVSAERSVKLREDLANLEEFSAEINSYKITVSASRAMVGSVLSCRKVSAQNLEEDITSAFSTLTGNAAVSLELYPTDYDAVDVNCVVKDATSNELYSFKKVLRKGYVVRGTQNIRALGAYNIDTLVLMDKSELVYDSAYVELKVGNLISQNGQISTFRKSDVANTLPGMHGRSGGRLILNSVNAVGEVRFNLRGTNAGVQDKTPEQPKQKPRGADGDCSRGSCDGADGARGDDAVNGYRGLIGGDSGRVVFTVDNESDVNVEFNYEPGKGSAGSAPSAPGLGGEGGRGDLMSVPGASVCPTGTGNEDNKCGSITVRGRPGRRGADGSPGVPGGYGSDGLNEESSLYFYATMQNYQINNSWSLLEGDL